MNVVIGKEAFRDPQLSGVGTYPGQGSLHGFLHHLADLPGHGEATFAFHAIRFDEEHVTAGRSPRQANRHTSAFGAFGNFALGPNFDTAEKFLNDFFRDNQLFRLAFGNSARLLARDCSDIAFQIANTRFVRVVPDNETDSLFGDVDLVFSDSVFLDLARDQVLEGDVDLLFFRVALQFDDFHAVAQRLRNRIEHVRRRDEKHLR